MSPDTDTVRGEIDQNTHEFLLLHQITFAFNIYKLLHKTRFIRKGSILLPLFVFNFTNTCSLSLFIIQSITHYNPFRLDSSEIQQLVGLVEVVQLLKFDLAICDMVIGRLDFIGRVLMHSMTVLHLQ